MAPLPSNNTPVLFIDYTAALTDHTAVVRLPLGATASTAATAYGVIAPAMANIMAVVDTVKGARFRAAGSTVSNDISVSAVQGTVNITVDEDRTPTFTSWVGRSSDGRRVKFTVFNPLSDIDTIGYRDLTPASLMEAIKTALVTVGARTISGELPVWKSYINLGENAYWQRQMRKRY